MVGALGPATLGLGLVLVLAGGPGPVRYLAVGGPELALVRLEPGQGSKARRESAPAPASGRASRRRRRSRRPGSRRLTLDFASAKAVDPLAAAPFAVAGGTERLELHGALSAGRAGWSLSAHVRLHRRTLHLWVTARQVDAAGGWDVEDHRYVATVADVPAGRYRLRVSHVYIPWGANAEPPGFEVFDRTVVVEGAPLNPGEDRDR